MAGNVSLTIVKGLSLDALYYLKNKILAEANTYTNNQIDALVDGAPAALDTLNEIAQLLSCDNDMISSLLTTIGNKVDKETGKGLSTNDYTTAEKNKLANIAAGAEVNVQSDWNLTTTTADDYIKNKPTNVSAFTNDSGYITSSYIVDGDSVYGEHDKAPSGYSVNAKLLGKLDTLSSGVNIKTINNQSLLGSGNITISAGSNVSISQSISVGTSATIGSTTYDIVSESIPSGSGATFIAPSWNATINLLKLSDDYVPSVLENEDLELSPNDTYEVAFGKLHKAILDNELITSASLIDLNNRVSALDEAGYLTTETDPTVLTWAKSPISINGNSNFSPLVLAFDEPFCLSNTSIKLHTTDSNHQVNIASILGTADLIYNLGGWEHAEDDTALLTMGAMKLRFALLASPAFTGTPTAPTASSGTNTTQIATTAFVQDAISDKVDKVTSTDNAVVRFDGTGGAIQNSGVTINDNNHITAVKFVKSGGTASQFLKADGSVDSTSYATAASDNNKVPYGGVLMPTNPFGGKTLYVNSLDNAFSSADQKYYVTVTKHNKSVNGVTYPYVDSTKEATDDDYYVDSPIVSTYSTSAAHRLFDGNYESNLTCSANEYIRIRIMFGENTSPSATTSYFLGYPYGNYYLSYYYNLIPDTASQCRVYNKFQTHGIGWHLYTATAFNGSLNNASLIERFIVNGDYYRSCVDFIIFGNSVSGRNVGITQIDYQLSRSNIGRDGSTVTKYDPQSLYHTFKWYNEHEETVSINNNGEVTATKFKKSGGTSSQFLKADGSVDSTTYQAQLVSGTNIKTINNESILGSGNITIQGGGTGGDTNIIETVKVNGTALTPDSNKAVDIDLSGYDKTPLIIEVGDSVNTVPAGTYASITTALSNGRKVFVKVYTDQGEGNINYCILPLVEKYYVEDDEDSYYFSASEYSVTFNATILNNDDFEYVVRYNAEDSHNHGNIQLNGNLQFGDITVANGDKLVVTDASDNSSVARTSITFDGSTTTTALTPKGTWETFLKTAPVQSVNGQTGAVSLALGDTNVVETIKVNNTALTPVSKAVNITVPVSLDDLLGSSSSIHVSQDAFDAKGTYSKPNGGIPKTDLASAVQTSLGLADTALQPSAIVDNTSFSSEHSKAPSGYAVSSALQGKADSATTLAGYGIADAKIVNGAITLGSNSITPLTSHLSIKTINNNTITGTGNITIATPGTLKSDNTTAQTTANNESLSGVVNLHKISKTGNYNDLIDKPTIPAAVTESTVSGWGFTKNAGTITGITMNGTSKGTSGVVNLGTVLTAHQDISGKANTADLATVATSGSYNDLSNKPTIPSLNTNLFTVEQGTTSLNSATGSLIDELNDLSQAGDNTFPTSAAVYNAIVAAINASKVTIYSGTAAPSNSLGTNGDLYLQTS